MTSSTRFLVVLLCGGAIVLAVQQLLTTSSMPPAALPDVSRARAVTAECPQEDRAAVLPTEAFAGDDSTDREARDYYSSFLIALGDSRRFWCGSPVATESYRLTALDLVPVVVSIEVVGQGHRLSVVVSRERAWKGPVVATAARREQRAVTDSEWQVVQNAVRSSGFWHMPSFTAEKCHGDCDSLPWILEGRRGNAYHIVTRAHLPADRSPQSEYVRFLTVARVMLTTAGLDTARGRSLLP